MSHDTAIRILNNHGIEHRFDGSQLQVLDVWTKDGILYTDWRVCPYTMCELKAWLGY